MSSVVTLSSKTPLFGDSPLVIASHNAGKVKEIGALTAPLGIKVISASEANVDEPEETGDSFAENATLKSESSGVMTGKPALSDDSGLVVPAIGGAPGIYSARWAGPNKDFTMAFERIRKELADLPADAYFICVLALRRHSEPATRCSNVRMRCMPAAALPTCTFVFAALRSLLWRAKRSMSMRARARVSYTEQT